MAPALPAPATTTSPEAPQVPEKAVEAEPTAATAEMKSGDVAADAEAGNQVAAGLHWNQKYSIIIDTRWAC